MEIVVAAVVCVAFVLIAWMLLKVVQAVVRVVVLVVVAIVTLSLCLTVGRPYLEDGSGWLRDAMGVTAPAPTTQPDGGVAEHHPDGGAPAATPLLQR